MTDSDPELSSLLEFVRDLRGFDFSGYKPSTLGRRIRKRMQDAGVKSWADYRDLLETDAEEFTSLFNTVLINVTGFFRDPEAWGFLRTEILPAILQSADEEVRVWSAGCSSGEEAYSLAMTFAEAMGIEAFNERVKIYATDIDEEALATARRGHYQKKALEAVPEELLGKYFEPSGDGMIFRPELRRRVIFGRLDLMTDAPISRLDLLCCRNTLMYFNAETQDQMLRRLHFALRDSGVLFLGKAEMLMSNGARFLPVSMPYRIFRCRPGSHVTVGPLAPVDVARALSNEALRHRQLRELALEGDSTARLIVDIAGTVVLVNAAGRAMFGLTERDEGRPLRDLEVSYRPAELRSLIEQAQSERRTLRMNAVERSLGPHDMQYLDVHVSPVVAGDGLVLGSMVTFIDSTSYVRLQQEVKSSREELETAYEELQSTNEELETMNEELRIRSTELDEVNTFLSGVLTSVSAGVIVLDSELRVRTWNRVSEELWGLRGDEVDGDPFFALDLGLPTGPLREPVRACMNGSREERVDVQAVNRRGQSISCTVTCTPLGPDGSGVVLHMEAGRR